MNVKKTELLYQGKAKSLFNTTDPELLIAEFRDDTTAFDGEKMEKLAHKGQVNCGINTIIMQKLAAAGVPTHFVEQISETESIVKRLTMVPLESVIRNIAAGSLCRRLGVEADMQLTPPLQEFFLKNDELHDPMINDQHAVVFGWATQSQLDRMRELSLHIHALLTDIFAQANLILVDAKYEFGVSVDGEITLGDEISPDSCRIWDKDTKEPLDKDRFRKDLGNVIGSYQVIAQRLGE